MKLIKIQYRGKNRENIKEILRYRKDRIKKIHHSVERDPEGKIIKNEETWKFREGLWILQRWKTPSLQIVPDIQTTYRYTVVKLWGLKKLELLSISGGNTK